MLKTQRADEVSGLLIQNQRALIKIMTHKETKVLISQIVNMKENIVAGVYYFSQNKTDKTIAMQMRYIKMLIQQLTICGSLLSQIGESNLCEQCYSIYVALVESIEGNNSLKAGQCYFWLAQYYSEEHAMNKAKICYLKTKEIYQHILGDTHPQVADCVFNLGIAMK